MSFVTEETSTYNLSTLKGMEYLKENIRLAIGKKVMSIILLAPGFYTLIIDNCYLNINTYFNYAKVTEIISSLKFALERYWIYNSINISFRTTTLVAILLQEQLNLLNRLVRIWLDMPSHTQPEMATIDKQGIVQSYWMIARFGLQLKIMMEKTFSLPRI